MNVLFLKPLVVDCIQLNPGMKFSKKQEAHFVTFREVLNIIDRHSGYTYIISCTVEINAAGLIHIFEKNIKQTIGLPVAILSDHDVLFI